MTRYACDADLAEDVVQETFVKLRERTPRNRMRLRGWLFTVATNLARDALSVAKRRRELERSAVELLKPAPAADPAEDAALADLRCRVRQALDMLTCDERTALLMYQEGFRHREIGEAIGKRTESVGGTVVRAARKIAAALKTEALK